MAILSDKQSTNMYIPSINAMHNQDEIVAFMHRFSFATIITSHQDKPVATHLPFVVKKENEKIVLTSHFAKANEQWKDIDNNINLVIFTEPHAYISPSNYEKKLNVPTWNYISVHAYGKGTIISDGDLVYKALEDTIETYEADYKHQWNDLSMDYKRKMANGIVAFEIVVTELQAKKKISQNRTDSEKEKIIQTLSNSADTNEQLIAHYMKEIE